MHLFAQVVLPVILIFFIGYVVQRWKRVDLKSVSTVVIFILTPSLVFRTFYTAEFNGQYLMMVVFALLLFFTLIILNMLYVNVMLVLGMQLAEIKLTIVDWDKLVYGTVMRLMISPLIAYGLVQMLPMDPLLQRVLIVTSAMPTAALAVIYSIQFDAEPELVSSVTFISTIASIVTITVLLAFLG